MIVLDATVLIAHLAGDDVHADRALAILDTEEELAIHPLTLAECLVGPARVHRDDEALEAIDRLGIEQLPFDTQQPLALARLRASTSLKLPDCCVLAAAIEAGARLATFDDKLARIARERGVETVG